MGLGRVVLYIISILAFSILLGCFPIYEMSDYDVMEEQATLQYFNDNAVRESMGFPLLNNDKSQSVNICYAGEIHFQEIKSDSAIDRKIISYINIYDNSIEADSSDDCDTYWKIYWHNESAIFADTFNSEGFDYYFGLKITYHKLENFARYYKVLYKKGIDWSCAIQLNVGEKDRITREEALKLKEILMHGNIEDLKKLYKAEYQE